MKLQFINHSSFSIQHDGIYLMIDPWLEGRVFNNGWDLITPTPIGYEEFEKVTHIWFSHEHPDHFFPPNLNKIPEEVRAKITVLFQVTKDKRVVNYCKKIGFREVIEMHPDTFIPLAPDLQLLCEHYQEGDSWLLIKSRDYTLLNTNDCGIRDKIEADKIKQKTGKIDLLLTQFSYAYWAGNKDQKEFRRKVADEKLDGLKFQVDIFQPQTVIPIASFVWFCHEENYYLNDEINTPGKVFDFIATRTNAKPVILYPGEEFWPGKEHDSEASIRYYASDYEKIRNSKDLIRTVTLPEKELIETGNQFVARLLKNHGIWAKLLKPARIFITDYNKSFILDLNRGMIPGNLPELACDASLSSESLAFNFRFPWGNDTLGINGRYQRPPQGNYSRFYNFFRYDQLASRGIQVGPAYLLKMILRKLLVKAGLQKI